jgi:hypothetical protein
MAAVLKSVRSCLSPSASCCSVNCFGAGAGAASPPPAVEAGGASAMLVSMLRATLGSGSGGSSCLVYTRSQCPGRAFQVEREPKQASCKGFVLPRRVVVERSLDGWVDTDSTRQASKHSPKSVTRVQSARLQRKARTRSADGAVRETTTQGEAWRGALLSHGGLVGTGKSRDSLVVQSVCARLICPTASPPRREKKIFLGAADVRSAENYGLPSSTSCIVTRYEDVCADQ